MRGLRVLWRGYSSCRLEVCAGELGMGYGEGGFYGCGGVFILTVD
jgi:hypothetical protein